MNFFLHFAEGLNVPLQLVEKGYKQRMSSSCNRKPPKYHPSTTQVEFLVQRMTSEYMGMTEIMEVCGMKNRKNFRLNYILPAISDGSIERKYSDQPKHPHQMYRLTEDAFNWRKEVE